MPNKRAQSMAGTNQTTPASPSHTSGGIVMGDEEPSTTAPDELQNTALPRERVEQFLFDLRHQPAWRKEADAADLAYVLYQVPILVAVHGSEMLKQAET